MKKRIQKLIFKDKVTKLNSIRKSITKEQPSTKEVTYLNMINDYLGHRVLIELMAKAKIEEQIRSLPEGVNELNFDYFLYTVTVYFEIKHIKSHATTHAPSVFEIDYEILNWEAVVEDVY